MNTDETKQKDTKQNQTKPKAKRGYPFPLPMDEACQALMDHISQTYGNEGTAVKLAVTKGEVVVTIEVG